MLYVYMWGYFRPPYIRRSSVFVPDGTGRYRLKGPISHDLLEQQHTNISQLGTTNDDVKYVNSSCRKTSLHCKCSNITRSTSPTNKIKCKHHVYSTGSSSSHPARMMGTLNQFFYFCWVQVFNFYLFESNVFSLYFVVLYSLFSHTSVMWIKVNSCKSI